MLDHTVIGPVKGGRFLVVYPTPGCKSKTIACDCLNKKQAELEKNRLNLLQVQREESIQRERDLCGFHRISTDLGAL